MSEGTPIKAMRIDDRSLIKFVSSLCQATIEVLHKKGIVTHEEVVEELQRFTDAYAEEAAKTIL